MTDRKTFTMSVKIMDEFGRNLFKINNSPVDKGVRELVKFVNAKLK